MADHAGHAALVIDVEPAQVDLVGVLDIDQDEREDREVEAVEHPAKERGPESPPLRRVDLPVPGTCEAASGD